MVRTQGLFGDDPPEYYEPSQDPDIEREPKTEYYGDPDASGESEDNGKIKYGGRELDVNLDDFTDPDDPDDEAGSNSEEITPESEWDWRWNFSQGLRREDVCGREYTAFVTILRVSLLTTHFP